MGKSTKKKEKRATSSKKKEKITKKQSKAAEYVGHLLELNKLQGAILINLYEEVK